MTVDVRLAQAADAAELAALAAETFELACPPATTREAIDAFIAANLSRERFDAYLVDPHRSILLAESNAEAVGYTMLVFGEPANELVGSALSFRPTVELSKVYVHAGAHGSGVAAPLMQRTLDEALGRGARGVWLGVNKLNARAIRFYEKSGFQIVGAKTFLVGHELHHDHVMERALG